MFIVNKINKCINIQRSIILKYQYMPFLTSSTSNLSSNATSSITNNKNEIFPRKIVSGVQPTGGIHLGNYLGAIRPWVNLQNSGENCTYFIADLHSITLPQDPNQLKHYVIEMIATLLACGLDPIKSLIFLQSSVRQHSELCWILGCMTTMPRLSHLPQYKEKSSKVKDIPLGLFIYPVLQAADVMVHKGTHVPCGEDQIQQLQLIQHLSGIFNTKYGNTFPICHGIVATDFSAKIKSLRDPNKKMSKSDIDVKSRIMLTDSSDQVLDKVKKALTDFTSEITYEPEKRPGITNLLTIHSLIDNSSVEDICLNCQGIDTGKYKLQLADILIEYVKPIREKIHDFTRNRDYLHKILLDGSARASEITEITLQEVKRKVGTVF